MIDCILFCRSILIQNRKTAKRTPHKDFWFSEQERESYPLSWTERFSSSGVGKPKGEKRELIANQDNALQPPSKKSNSLFHGNSPRSSSSMSGGLDPSLNIDNYDNEDAQITTNTDLLNFFKVQMQSLNRRMDDFEMASTSKGSTRSRTNEEMKELPIQETLDDDCFGEGTSRDFVQTLSTPQTDPFLNKNLNITDEPFDQSLLEDECIYDNADKPYVPIQSSAMNLDELFPEYFIPMDQGSYNSNQEEADFNEFPVDTEVHSEPHSFIPELHAGGQEQMSSNSNCMEILPVVPVFGSETHSPVESTSNMEYRAIDTRKSTGNRVNRNPRSLADHWFIPPSDFRFSDFPWHYDDQPIEKEDLSWSLVGERRVFRPTNMNKPGVVALVSRSTIFDPSAKPKVSDPSAFDDILPAVLTAKKDQGTKWTRIPGKKAFSLNLSKSSMEILHLSSEERKKKFAGQVPLLVEGTSGSSSQVILEALQAPKLKKETSKVDGPLEGYIPPILERSAVIDLKNRQSLHETLLVKEAVDLLKGITQSTSVSDLKDETLLKLHLNMTNRVTQAVSRLADRSLARSAEEFVDYRKAMMKVLARPIQTESVRHHLEEASPFHKDLWSARRKDLVISAARQARIDQSLKLNKQVIRHEGSRGSNYLGRNNFPRGQHNFRSSFRGHYRGQGRSRFGRYGDFQGRHGNNSFQTRNICEQRGNLMQSQIQRQGPVPNTYQQKENFQPGNQQRGSSINTVNPSGGGFKPKPRTSLQENTRPSFPKNRGPQGRGQQNRQSSA